MSDLRDTFNCYVHVTGEASEEEDDGVQGYYLIEVNTSEPVDLDALTEAQETQIAKAVLDDFHNHQGIECLDDFNIDAYLENGRAIGEHDPEADDTGLARASHGGMVNDDDPPKAVRRAVKEAKRAAKALSASISSSMGR